MLLKMSSINQSVRVFENAYEDTVKMSVGNAVEIFFHVLGRLTLAEYETPPSCSMASPPQQDMGRKLDEKARRLRLGVHFPIIVIGRTDLRILIYC